MYLHQDPKIDIYYKCIDTLYFALYSASYERQWSISHVTLIIHVHEIVTLLMMDSN